jgi:hypothetical protein
VRFGVIFRHIFIDMSLAFYFKCVIRSLWISFQGPKDRSEAVNTLATYDILLWH